MPDNNQQEERPRDFELIELLFRKQVPVRSTVSTDPQLNAQLEDFVTRCQSWVDQIQSYLHSSDKKGFFPRVFFGMFSTLLNTRLNTEKELNVKKLYFHLDDKAETLTVVAAAGQDKANSNQIDKVNVFIFSERSTNTNHASKFSQGEWNKIKGKINLPAQTEKITPEIKLIKITKDIKKDKNGEEESKIKIEVEDKAIDSNVASPAFEFTEINQLKNSAGRPIYFEDYMAKLASSNVDQVKENFKEILTDIAKIYANYPDMPYGSGLDKNKRIKEFREANQHGFVIGVLENFKYRYNAKIYLEQFAGRGYADIVLLVRGPNREVNVIPIIIELKAGITGTEITPSDALRQVEDYTKGFAANKMRILSTANNVFIVGLNLDYASSPAIKNALDMINDSSITTARLKARLNRQIQDQDLLGIINRWNDNNRSHLKKKIEEYNFSLAFNSKMGLLIDKKLSLELG